MKKNRVYLGLIFSLLIGISTQAEAVTADISIANTVLAAMSAASTQLMSQAIIWLGAFMAIQFVLTNLGLLKSGADIEAIIGKLIGSLMWFGFCVYVLNNGPAFIDSVGTGILGKYAPNIPTPGSLITLTAGLCTAIAVAIVAVGTSLAGFGNSSVGMLLVYVLFIVFSVGMLLAIKVFMLTLELGLIVLLSPLSFSFLGLNALKDQGIAPFKALISLVYRIILLGIICSASTHVFTLFKETIDALSWAPDTWGDTLEALISALFAFPLLGYLAYKSDSIAATLASGSTNMGTGDVAGAAAAGAAAGALAAGAAGGVAGTKPTSMGDVISKMMGGGSVSNASPAGSMQNMAPPPPKPASASNSLSDRPPVRGGGEAGSGEDAAQNNSLASATNSVEPSKPASASNSEGGDNTSSGTSGVNAGNGTTAEIGGAGGGLEKAVGDLVAAMNQPKKPGFGERLGNANRQIEQEKAATHVSISTHHSD